MAVTLAEVARTAGVSTMTASRAISGSGKVDPGTQQRVREAARTLGYRPNRSAARLRGARTNRLGLIVPDMVNPFFADVLKGVQARARDRGQSVFVADIDDDARLEREMLTTLAQRSDGLLLATSRLDDQQLLALDLPVPLVLLHRVCDGLPSVITDVADGVRQAIENLAALGHREIGYVDGPAESWSAGLRRRAIAEVRLPAEVTVRTVTQVAARIEGGIAAADLVISSGVTAVMAFNDIVALGVLHRLLERGVDVPDDISLVGFDGIPVAGMSTPGITTVAQPLAASGKAAVDLLADLIAGDQPATAEITLPPLLIVRDSTGPRRSGER